MVSRYSIHGNIVEFNGGGSVLRRLEQRLGLFERTAVLRPELVFRYEEKEPAAAQMSAGIAGSRTIYEFPEGEARYWPGAEKIIIRHGSRVECCVDLRAGHAIHLASGMDANTLWSLSHPFLTLALIELLKARGLFHLHAAGAVRDRRGILLAGVRGSGKSTLALALLREGMDFLADDTVFLSTRTGELRALGFPENVDAAPATLAMFPELSREVSEEPSSPWGKRGVSPFRLFGIKLAWEAAPEIVIFPRVRAHTKESELTRISRSEAFLELVPNVLLTEPAASRVHMQILEQLAKCCECFRMDVGSDVAAAARMVKQLIG